MFSESDLSADFPSALRDNSYKFTPANEWSVKFENAIRFNRPGIQDIYVYDLNQETIMWFAEVEVTEAEVMRNVSIDILNPESAITLARDNVTVSWTTDPNHQVNIKINGVRDVKTISNQNGTFEVNVRDLNQWENTFQAQVLNANEQVVGESSVVRIQVNSLAPEFRRITLDPDTDIETGSQINIEVIATAQLNEVHVIIDDVIAELSESQDGRYNWEITAPEEVWSFPVTVILRNDFNIEARENDVAEITTIKKHSAAPVEPEEPEEELQQYEIIKTGISGSPSERSNDLDLAIRDIRVIKLKERSIISWKEAPDAESYNIYKKINDTQIELIANTKETHYEIKIVWEEIKYEDFAIKAIGRTQAGTIVQWDLSDMTKVQTGPVLYFVFFIIAMMITGWIFFFREKIFSRLYS